MLHVWIRWSLLSWIAGSACAAWADTPHDQIPAATAVVENTPPKNKNNLRSFAQNFHCSNPDYQWLYENLPSFARANELDQVEPAKRQLMVGGGPDGEHLYRGAQWSELPSEKMIQILLHDPAVIFQMGGSFLRARNPSNLASFKSAVTEANKFLNNSVVDENGRAKFYDPDQFYFQAPYVWTAPDLKTTFYYGRNFYEIHEVTPRGLDVTRHELAVRNYVNLPAVDKDEVVVPVMIPPWDIEAFTIGDSNIHLRKLFTPGNPCDSKGIEVAEAGVVTAFIVPCTSNCSPNSKPGLEKISAMVSGVLVGGHPLEVLTPEEFKAREAAEELKKKPATPPSPKKQSSTAQVKVPPKPVSQVKKTVAVKTMPGKQSAVRPVVRH